MGRRAYALERMYVGAVYPHAIYIKPAHVSRVKFQ